MGTRSQTIFKEAGSEFAVLYRQFDGYPTGHGRDILAALGGKPVVNGFSNDKQINGAGDMAVQLIAYCKARATADREPEGVRKLNVDAVAAPGNFYLHPAENRTDWCDYTYVLNCPSVEDNRAEGDPKVRLEIFSGNSTELSDRIFDGWVDEFDPQDVERKLNEEDDED